MAILYYLMIPVDTLSLYFSMRDSGEPVSVSLCWATAFGTAQLRAGHTHTHEDVMKRLRVDK